VSGDRVIGVDLGGTKILAGLVDRDGTVGERHEVPTPVESQEALLGGLEEAVAGLFSEEVAALGFGVPSVVDPTSGVSLGSINIPLEGVSVAAVLGERFAVPAGVENDASAAALGEWRAGAGRGLDDLIMLTLGTGVGGGVVVGGRLFRGWAELGHVVVLADGPACQGTCTGRGHLEALASGNAADRAAERLWGPGATAEHLVGRAREGDVDAVGALEEIGRLLGAGIGSLVNAFGAQLVVVGGGFGIAAADFLFGPALDVARREALAPAQAGLRIVAAELGEDAGLVGAGFVGFAALDGDR
jgi:glucokinase